MGTHVYRLLKAVSSNLIKPTFFSSRQRQSIILPEDDKLSFRLRPIKFPSPNSKLLPGNVNTASYNCRERTGAQYWKRGAKRKNLWEVVWGIFIFTFCLTVDFSAYSFDCFLPFGLFLHCGDLTCSRQRTKGPPKTEPFSFGRPLKDPPPLPVSSVNRCAADAMTSTGREGIFTVFGW